MTINKALRFEPFDRKEHHGECNICGRERLGPQDAVAVFHPNEPALYAAPYCRVCIRGLVSAHGPRAKKKSTPTKGVPRG